MASTTFIDNQTVIYAAWLNDVNNTVYNGSFPNGSITVTNLIATNATITNLTSSYGDFTITPLGTKLYISYLGTNVMSVDSSGNVRALGSFIAGTTP